MLQKRESRTSLQCRLSTTEQKLHILRRQTLHSTLIRVDSRIDHIRLLLLQQDHSTLNRILNTQSCDRARTGLSNTMTTISGLPFSSRVPPSVDMLATYIPMREVIKTYGSTMNTLEASVKLSATPPAFRDTRKTSTSGFVIK